MKVNSQFSFSWRAVEEEIEQERFAASDWTVQVKALGRDEALDWRILGVEVGNDGVGTVVLKDANEISPL